MKTDLECFLRPKSIAIIGASDVPSRVGYMFIANLIECGFDGKIFPVHPRLDSVRDLKVYPNLESIPDSVDLAIVAVKP